MEKTRHKKGRAPVILAVCGVFLFCLCIFPLGFACVLFFPIDTAGCYSDAASYTVLVALQIFYDGGDFPVIALSANGKEYLPQEIGLQNQAAYSRAADASDLAMFRKIFFPALAVQIVALGMSVAGTVWKKKGEKRDCPPA